MHFPCIEDCEVVMDGDEDHKHLPTDRLLAMGGNNELIGRFCKRGTLQFDCFNTFFLVRKSQKEQYIRVS